MIYQALFIVEILLITVYALLVVAYVTIAERKTMASMQTKL
jgi:NADH:ubiquinone oxidoreductase subunit H